jgi:hypothetical protein
MNKGYYIIGIYALCIISFIFIYGKIRCDYKGYYDPLQFKLPFWDLDGWSVTHFIAFTLLGFVYPEYTMISMMYGILWELFEFYYGYFQPQFLANWGHCVIPNSSSTGSIWWYGKMSDFVMNGSGLLLGNYIASFNGLHYSSLCNGGVRRRLHYLS